MMFLDKKGKKRKEQHQTETIPLTPQALQGINSQNESSISELKGLKEENTANRPSLTSTSSCSTRDEQQNPLPHSQTLPSNHITIYNNSYPSIQQPPNQQNLQNQQNQQAQQNQPQQQQTEGNSSTASTNTKFVDKNTELDKESKESMESKNTPLFLEINEFHNTQIQHILENLILTTWNSIYSQSQQRFNHQIFANIIINNLNQFSCLQKTDGQLSQNFNPGFAASQGINGRNMQNYSHNYRQNYRQNFRQNYRQSFKQNYRQNFRENKFGMEENCTPFEYGKKNNLNSVCLNENLDISEKLNADVLGDLNLCNQNEVDKSGGMHSNQLFADVTNRINQNAPVFQSERNQNQNPTQSQNPTKQCLRNHFLSKNTLQNQFPSINNMNLSNLQNINPPNSESEFLNQTPFSSNYYY